MPQGFITGRQGANTTTGTNHQQALKEVTRLVTNGDALCYLYSDLWTNEQVWTL